MNAFMGLDSVIIPTDAFQAAARDILSTYGSGGPIKSVQGLGEAGPDGRALLAGGITLGGATIATLVSIYIFRHVKDEKNTFWKVVGYGGGIMGMLSAFSFLFGTVGIAVNSFGVRQSE
jgi:hypothetical protein